MNSIRFIHRLLIISILSLVFFEGKGQFASGVSSYLPAPGQYTNADFIGTPQAAKSLTGTNKGLVSLGAYGGGIVLHFPSGVKNEPNNPYGVDFTIYGNATPTWSEPGIIQVMKDENGNGLADETWYEIAGSDHYWNTTIQNYEITYLNSGSETASNVRWLDNKGIEGYVPVNTYHRQTYYPKPNLFPEVPVEQYKLRGTRIAGQIDLSNPEIVNSYRRAFGYADNTPVMSFTEKMPDNPYTPETEGSGGDAIDIEWAVNQEGKHVKLDEIHFIRIYTGMNAVAGWLGEISTEITGIRDVEPALSYPASSILVIQDLPQKIRAGENYPLAAIFFEQGKKNDINPIDWTIDRPDLATIENGILKAFRAGKIRIRAFIANNTAIYAEKELEIFSAGKAVISLASNNLKVNDRIVLSGKFTDQNGNMLTGITPSWRVDRQIVAEISQMDGVFFLNGKSTGKCWLYLESKEIKSLRDSVSIQVFPESVFKKVYISVKTEDKTLIPRRSLWVESFDLTKHVNRPQKSYTLNDSTYVSLAHAIASVYKNSELENEWAFRDDAEGGNVLYLWRIAEAEEGSVAYHLGYGGSRSGTSFRKTWMVMLNQFTYVNGFDKVRINNDDEILIYQINDNLLPWSVSHLTTGPDTLKLNELANLQLMRYNCSMNSERLVTINSSDVLANQNVQVEWRSTVNSITNYRTDEFGKLSLKMEKAGKYLFVSGANESNLFVESTTNAGPIKLTDKTVKAFPNPFSNFLQLESSYKLDCVEVFDMQGCLVYNEWNPSSSINLSALAKGIYLLKVTSAKTISQLKIIKN